MNYSYMTGSVFAVFLYLNFIPDLTATNEFVCVLCCFFFKFVVDDLIGGVMF